MPALAIVFAVPQAVGAKTPPTTRAAIVKVVKSGFLNQISQSEYFPVCGVELRNVSHRDARNVVVTVTWVGVRGRPLGTVRSDLALIPAGRNFYMSCSQTDGLAVRVASLRVGVTVRRSTSPEAKLPAVTQLKLRRDSCGGTAHAAVKFAPAKCGSATLTGRIANRYATRFSPDAEIYAVFFDARGKIVGGASDDTTAALLKSGNSVPFLLSYFGSHVVSAKVSVDPCGIDAFIGQCRVP